MNALISVFDKQGIETVAQSLHQAGWTIFSTGGTATYLKQNNIPVIEVSDITKFPEILDGRVKTLHPKIFAPILAKNTPNHLEQLSNIGVEAISLVIVNFYPFESALSSDRANDTAYMSEQIDIGGPAMVRASAKNHERVTIIVDPDDYSIIDDFLKENTPSPSLEIRKKLAFKAFSYTSYYDHLVASYFQKISHEEMPLFYTFAGRKIEGLRYGENPQQSAAFYQSSPLSPLAQMRTLSGKPLSFNNMLDLSTVYEITNTFINGDFFSVILKHQNPCGAATALNQTDAYLNALSGDPISSYGGVVGFNRPVSYETAKELNKTFFEIIVAPEFDQEAFELLKKKKNLRLIQLPPAPLPRMEIKQLADAFLLQTTDIEGDDEKNWTYMNGSHLPDYDRDTVLFGLKMIRFVKSNAIILVKNNLLIGVGAGQMSRVDAVHLAIKKAAEASHGSIMISDAFFPFPDSIELASLAGIETIVEPGGSVRDNEVVKRAKELNLRLIFSGIRHFRH